MEINDKLKEIGVKDCTCFYFDKIIKIEDLEINKIFASSSKFLMAKYFSFIIKKVFLHQKSFPQANIFSSSRTFPTNKYLSYIKEVFHKQIFSLHQRSLSSSDMFPFIKKVILYQGSFPLINVFHDHKSFLEVNYSNFA